MTDDPNDATPADGPAGETPMQRALRLKKAAQEARQKAPGAKLQPSKHMAAGASRPWMKR